MQVKEVMTAGVECVASRDTLQTVARKMRDLDVGSFPVCDNDRLTGIITDRDIAIRCVADGLDPATATTQDAMTHELVYCTVDQSVEDVAELMRKRQIRRVPVLDANKRMVGIVALADLALESNDRLSGDTLEAISKPK